MIKITEFIFIFLLLNIGISKSNNNSTDYLKKVLNNLEKIESATYSELRESWQPGDTVATSIFCRLVNEFSNPVDSTIGANYVSFDCDVPTKLEFAYDGKVRVLVYHDEKSIIIDDFTEKPLPFRPLSPPFFNYTKNIIQYILTTKESIVVDLKEFGDCYFIKLVINEDKQIEFFGKAYHMPENPYNKDGTTSIYELWINKSSNLPYRVRREMSHNISVTTCLNAEFNKLFIADFSVYDYFPANYEIRKYGMKRERKESDLIGKKAPDWILYDKNEQSISLADLKGKVSLIQFTGIGCGPCQASIPFLKELREKYSKDKFELIAIEGWRRKPHSLQNYSKRNELNYNLLCGTDEVIKDYQTSSFVPVFFILDQEQIIRNVINGYSEEAAKQEILNSIAELL